MAPAKQHPQNETTTFVFIITHSAWVCMQMGWASRIYCTSCVYGLSDSYTSNFMSDRGIDRDKGSILQARNAGPRRGCIGLQLKEAVQRQSCRNIHHYDVIPDALCAVYNLRDACGTCMYKLCIECTMHSVIFYKLISFE